MAAVVPRVQGRQAIVGRAPIEARRAHGFGVRAQFGIAEAYGPGPVAFAQRIVEGEALRAATRTVRGAEVLRARLAIRLQRCRGARAGVARVRTAVRASTHRVAADRQQDATTQRPPRPRSTPVASHRRARSPPHKMPSAARMSNSAPHRCERWLHFKNSFPGCQRRGKAWKHTSAAVARPTARRSRRTSTCATS